MVFLVAWGVGPPGGGARAASAATEADAAIKHGLELRRRGDDLRALEEFQRAQSLQRSARVLAQIGFAEQALGRWREAEEHLGLALADISDAWIRRHREVIERSRAVVAGHLGSLEVLGGPEGAELSIDGSPIGRLPLGRPVRVAAGRIGIELAADGFLPATRPVTITAGQLARETVTLQRIEPPPVVSPQITPATAAGGARTDRGGGASGHHRPPARAGRPGWWVATDRGVGRRWCSGSLRRGRSRGAGRARSLRRSRRRRPPRRSLRSTRRSVHRGQRSRLRGSGDRSRSGRDAGAGERRHRRRPGARLDDIVRRRASSRRAGAFSRRRSRTAAVRVRAGRRRRGPPVCRMVLMRAFSVAASKVFSSRQLKLEGRARLCWALARQLRERGALLAGITFAGGRRTGLPFRSRGPSRWRGTGPRRMPTAW